MEKKKNNSYLTTVPALHIFIDWIYNNPGCGLYLAAKQTHITYSHLGKLKRELTNAGWIESIENGRRVNMIFTPKGKRIAEAVVYLNQVMEEADNVNN